MVQITNKTVAKILILTIFISISGYVYGIYKIDQYEALYKNYQLKFVSTVPTGQATQGNVSINIQPPPQAGQPGGITGGGGATRGLGPSEEEPAPGPQPPVPPPMQPIIQFPEYPFDKISLSEEFENTDISCLFAEKRISQQKIAAERIPLDEKIVPKGYEAVISPFKMNCSGDDLDLTLNLPDNFNDIKMLRCRNGVCVELTKQISQEEFICGGEEIRELRIKQLESITEYILPEEITRFQEEKKTLVPPETKISSEEYTIEFLTGKKIDAEIRPPAYRIPQPNNPSLRVVGTPMSVKISSENPGVLPARIVMPFPLLKGFEINSLEIYYFSHDGWRRIGGIVDVKDNTVAVEIGDIYHYMLNNEATFAVVGIKCTACPDSQLKKVYDPGARDAVILVHGFASSPDTWQPFVDDVVLNKQKWQILTFAYPFTKSVSDIADEFSSFMESHSGEFDNVYVVAHSLGAFVVQEALYDSYENDASYVKKVKGVILVGSPNDGTPSAEIFVNLFDFLLDKKLPYSVFNANSSLLKELAQGKRVSKIPKIDYYVLAGTRTYKFNLGFFTKTTTELLNLVLPNDGITTTVSAQHVGDSYINNTCKDYFEIDLTHTELIDHSVSRRIIERIVTQESSKRNKDLPIIGYNQYLRFKIQNCNSEDRYIVVGKRIREEQTKAPLNCYCGNGYCGEGEDEANCPSDCAEVEYTESLCFFLPIIIYILLAITVLVTSIVVAIENIRRDKQKHVKLLRIILYSLLLICIALVVYHYYTCNTPLYLAYLVLVFIVGLDTLDLLMGRRKGISSLSGGSNQPTFKEAGISNNPPETNKSIERNILP